MTYERTEDLCTLKDPIYRNLYITHRPSTGITMLYYVTVTVLMFVMKASVSDIP